MRARGASSRAAAGQAVASWRPVAPGRGGPVGVVVGGHHFDLADKTVIDSRFTHAVIDAVAGGVIVPVKLLNQNEVFFLKFFQKVGQACNGVLTNNLVNLIAVLGRHVHGDQEFHGKPNAMLMKSWFH